jgi:hypothetical protein
MLKIKNTSLFLLILLFITSFPVNSQVNEDNIKIISINNWEYFLLYKTLYIHKVLKSNYTINNDIENGTILISGTNKKFPDVLNSTLVLKIYNPVDKLLKDISEIVPDKTTDLCICYNGILFLGQKTIYLDFKTGIKTDLSEKIPKTQEAFFCMFIKDSFYVQGWKERQGWSPGPPVFWSLNPETMEISDLTNLLNQYYSIIPGINRNACRYAADASENTLLCAYSVYEDFKLVEFDLKNKKAYDLTDDFNNKLPKINPYTNASWITLQDKKTVLERINWFRSEFILHGIYGENRCPFYICYNPELHQFTDITSLYNKIEKSFYVQPSLPFDSYWDGERIYYVGDGWYNSSSPRFTAFWYYYPKYSTFVACNKYIDNILVKKGLYLPILNSYEGVIVSNNEIILIYHTYREYDVVYNSYSFNLYLIDINLNTIPIMHLTVLPNNIQESGFYKKNEYVNITAKYVLNRTESNFKIYEYRLTSYTFNNNTYYINSNNGDEYFKNKLLIDKDSELRYNYILTEKYDTYTILITICIFSLIILPLIIIFMITRRKPK